MVKKRGKGRAVKRARQKFGLHYEDEETKLAPHTMIFHRGDCDKALRHLVRDMRQVMEPYTATNLKNTKKNNLKDFISIAGPLHVSHLMIFNETDQDGYIKMMRLPRGPTLQFRIEEFSLNKDVISSIKKPSTNTKQFLHQPLLVLNGFQLNTQENDENSKPKMHHKLMATMFQNMFPSINIAKVHLNDIRRCAMLNYNAEDETIDFRHYNIKITPVGLSKPVKKLVQEKIPDLSNFQDISEYIEKGGLLSESEAELDTADNRITVPEDMNTRHSINLKNTTSAIRLTEIGPRMKLKLIKIQEGICEGEVLYHMFMNKTPEEIQKIRENLKKNKQKQKTKKPKIDEESKPKKRKFKDYEVNENVDGDDEDDVEYFKEEVGMEPAEGFFHEKQNKKKLRKSGDSFLAKSIELDDDINNNKKDSDSEFDDNKQDNKKQKIVKFAGKPKIDNKKGKPLFLRFSNKKKQSFKK